jgi:hypothetical protein
MEEVQIPIGQRLFHLQLPFASPFKNETKSLQTSKPAIVLRINYLTQSGHSFSICFLGSSMIACLFNWLASVILVHLDISQNGCFFFFYNYDPFDDFLLDFIFVKELVAFSCW